MDTKERSVVSLVTAVHIPTTDNFARLDINAPDGWTNPAGFPEEDWIAVDDSLGKHKQVFPVLDGYKDFPLFPYLHKSSASKNYALYEAYKRRGEYIFIIDSDCIPDKDFISKHIEALNRTSYGWTNPLRSHVWFPRGFPYTERSKRVVCNMGLWTNVLDINGKDRRENEPKDPNVKGFHPVTGYVPLSGMNLCIRREAAPCLFFLPNFHDFKRHDDIFGGYIFQKFVHKKGDALTYGEPLVFHETVVDPYEDEVAERALNEEDVDFYKIVDRIFEKIKKAEYVDMLQQFDETMFLGTRFEPLIEPFKLWKQLFQR